MIFKDSLLKVLGWSTPLCKWLSNHVRRAQEMNRELMTELKCRKRKGRRGEYGLPRRNTEPRLGCVANGVRKANGQLELDLAKGE